MKTNPGAITRPTVRIRVNGRPVRKLAWQLTPLTACLQDIKDGFLPLGEDSIAGVCLPVTQASAVLNNVTPITQIARVTFFPFFVLILFIS